MAKTCLKTGILSGEIWTILLDCLHLKNLSNGGIMFNVLLPFFVPVFCAFCRSSVSAIVSVPKASVNENRYVLVKKNKVGMPFNVIVPTPSGDMPFGKILDKFSFGTFVPGRLNTLHDLRSF